MRTTQIALIEGDKIIKEKAWESANNEAERLLPEIAKLTKGFEGIDKIIVVKGPGSFTGIRIGVVVANTIAYLKKIKIYTVNTFDFIRAKYGFPEKLPLVLYAGRSEVYVINDSSSLESKSDPITLKVEDIGEIKEAFGEILKEQKKYFKKTKLLKSKKTFGQTIIALRKDDMEVCDMAQPLYIKQPGICSTLSQRQ